MVTIIITTYNRPDYLERAIESVLKQTYHDIEIIVVDDNNPDTEGRKCVEKLMKKYETSPNLIYIKHEKNKNGAAARNTGIRVAKGEYITFLDDDDYFITTRIEKLVKTMKKNKEYEAIYTGVITMNNSKILSITNANRKGNFQKELLMQKSFFATGSNLFFKADVFKKLKGFDEKFTRHQDIEFMIRFFEFYSILGVDEPLVVKNQDSRMNVPNIDKYLKIKKIFFDTFQREIKQLSEEDKNKCYFANYFEILKLAVRWKKYKKAYEIYQIIKQYKSFSLRDTRDILKEIVYNYIRIIPTIKTNINHNKWERQLSPQIRQEITEKIEVNKNVK